MIPSWVHAYGLPGEPMPIPRDDLFVGGPANGKRQRVPDEWYDVRVPIPPKGTAAFYSDGLPPISSELLTATYQWQTIRLCWDAAPVRVLVHEGTEESTAIALYGEHRCG